MEEKKIVKTMLDAMDGVMSGVYETGDKACKRAKELMVACNDVVTDKNDIEELVHLFEIAEQAMRSNKNALITSHIMPMGEAGRIALRAAMWGYESIKAYRKHMVKDLEELFNDQAD